MFAKLYNDTEYGQILIKIDSGEDAEAEVRFYFEPENLGVCSVALSFDGDEAWDRADKFFDELNEEKAIKAVKGTVDEINGLLGK